MNAQNHTHTQSLDHGEATQDHSDDEFMIFNIHPRRDVPEHGEHHAEHGQADAAHD
ncbi:MAG: hypothetical protein V4562_03640 [Pseudomonadota bacterium]